MVKVNHSPRGVPLPCELYLDGKLKENYDVYDQKVQRNWDFVGLIVGGEGDGKTEFGAQSALYLDPTFNVGKIVFNLKQLEEVIDDDDIPKGSCVMYDEADEMTAHHASKIITILKRKFKRIRKKNLFIWLVTPSFFDFGKYFVMHRVRCLIHIHSSGYQRGFFRFFNKSSMRQLYIYGKKNWDMGATRPDFRGRFTKCPKDFPFSLADGSDYDRKKDLATKEVSDDGLNPQEAVMNARRQALLGLDLVLGNELGITLNYRQKADIFGVDPSLISKDYRHLRRDG